MPSGGKRAKCNARASLANVDEKPTAPKLARLARCDGGRWGRGGSNQHKAVAEIGSPCAVGPGCSLDRLPGCFFYHHLVPLLDIQSRISLRCLSHGMCKTVEDNLPPLGPSTLYFHGSYLDKDKKPGYPYAYMRYEVCFSGIRGEVIVSIDEQRFEHKYPRLIETWLQRIVERYGDYIVEFDFKGQGDWDQRTHRSLRLSYFKVNRHLMEKLSRLPNLRRLLVTNDIIANHVHNIYQLGLHQKLDVIVRSVLYRGADRRSGFYHTFIGFYCIKIRHLVVNSESYNGIHSLSGLLAGRREIVGELPSVDSATTSITADMFRWCGEPLDVAVSLCPVLNLRVVCIRTRDFASTIFYSAHIQFNILLFSNIILERDEDVDAIKQLVQTMRCRRVLLWEEQDYTVSETRLAEHRMEREHAPAAVAASVAALCRKRSKRFERLVRETGARVADPDSEWWKGEACVECCCCCCF